jgi:IstB-like ATP binding protein
MSAPSLIERVKTSLVALKMPRALEALLDSLLHHAVVIQIEGSSYRLREHADLLPENVRFKPNAAANPIPLTLKRRGRPPKNGGADNAHD